MPNTSVFSKRNACITLVIVALVAGMSVLFIQYIQPNLAAAEKPKPPLPLTIENIRSYPAIEGNVAAIYGIFKNDSNQPVVFTGFDTPVAQVNEIHVIAMEEGIMRMRAIPQLTIPAGESVALRPGGTHLMLINLVSDLKVGDQLPVTFHFEAPSPIEHKLQVPVISR